MDAKPIKYSKSTLPLFMNIQCLVDTYGMNRLVFATFTFEGDVMDPKEAQRRWNSLNSNFLKKYIVSGVVVIEPTKRGVCHFHACLVLPFSFAYTAKTIADIKKGNYRTTDPELRAFWALMRSNLPTYGFGRSQFIPWHGERTMAKYMTKYFTKTRLDLHTGVDKELWKGVRLIRYLGNSKASKLVFLPDMVTSVVVAPLFGWRVCSCRYTWVEGGRAFRQKLADIARMTGLATNDYEGMQDIVTQAVKCVHSRVKPCKWAYWLTELHLSALDVFQMTDFYRRTLYSV